MLPGVENAIQDGRPIGCVLYVEIAQVLECHSHSSHPILPLRVLF